MKAKRSTDKRKVYSAFILNDDGTWRQPTFSVPAGSSEEEIERALFDKYGGFYVAGLQPSLPSDGTPEDCVDELEVNSSTEKVAVVDRMDLSERHNG